MAKVRVCFSVPAENTLKIEAGISKPVLINIKDITRVGGSRCPTIYMGDTEATLGDSLANVVYGRDMLYDPQTHFLYMEAGRVEVDNNPNASGEVFVRIYAASDAGTNLYIACKKISREG